MNLSFLRLLMQKTQFPPEAEEALLDSAEALKRSGREEALDAAAAFFREQGFSVQRTQPLVDALASQAGESPYTVWLLLLMTAAEDARRSYLDRGVPESVVWDTFSDFRCKALECKRVHGVWGTFVAFWYPIFFTGHIVKLGRLEYESIPYEWDEPYTQNGLTVKKGDPVKNIHIPSSGEPFDREARLASYRRAYEFFREELKGGPLVCVCSSWLLYPGYEGAFPPGSNIADFRRDFTPMGSQEEEHFDDAWRVFGAEAGVPADLLPGRTSLQRAFRDYIKESRGFGEGRGILVFDGSGLVNRR